MVVGQLTSVHFGLALPQAFTDADIDPDIIQLVAQRADASAVHSLWTQSQLVGRADVLEPMTLLSFAAGVTQRVMLGMSVLVLPEHAPAQAAKQIATLDQLSQGRLIVGLGTGAPGLTQRMPGLEAGQPTQRLLEGLNVMKALWKDDNPAYCGSLFEVRDVCMNPKPFQRPHPPLWLGGRSAIALRRAVLYGDGWMGPGASSTTEFGQDVANLHTFLARADRDPRSFMIAKRVYTALDDRRIVAARKLERWHSCYSGQPERATRVSVYGTPDDVLTGLLEVAESGADLVLINPVYDFVEQQQAILETLGIGMYPDVTP